MEQLNFEQPNFGVGPTHKIQAASSSIPTTHTQNPLITGTSVIAVKFKDGVVIAADNLGT